jgi:hypothetical protein
MAGRFAFQSPGGPSGGTPWFRVGTLAVDTATLVTGLGVASLFVWAISRQIIDALWLDPSRVLSGQIWRLITWPLANQPTLWVLIGFALFWYFGRQIESLIGRNRFAWFLGLVTVIPAVVAAIISLPQAGFRPIQFAVLLLFIAQYPFVRFFFGIPGWALGAVFLGLEVLQLVGLRDSRGIVFLFVTLATAAVAGRTFGLMPQLGFIPALGTGSSSRTRRDSKPARPSKRKRSQRTDRSAPGTVVKGPWAPPTTSAESDTPQLQRELDGLLDKISAGGMDALSTDEKRRLNELSKLLR